MEAFVLNRSTTTLCLICFVACRNKCHIYSLLVLRLILGSSQSAGVRTAINQFVGCQASVLQLVVACACARTSERKWVAVNSLLSRFCCCSRSITVDLDAADAAAADDEDDDEGRFHFSRGANVSTHPPPRQRTNPPPPTPVPTSRKVLESAFSAAVPLCRSQHAFKAPFCRLRRRRLVQRTQHHWNTINRRSFGCLSTARQFNVPRSTTKRPSYKCSDCPFAFLDHFHSLKLIIKSCV